MKKIIKFILSSSLTLSLWFYFDTIFSKIRVILFPKKTVLEEVYNEMTKKGKNTSIEPETIEIVKIKEDKNYLDYLDYLFWGDQNLKERLKTEGIWNTLWKPYLNTKNTTKSDIDTPILQPSTNEAVIKTDEQIRDTVIKSSNHIQDVLFNYFENNMSWIDYSIIQGFKLLAIFIFFLIIYFLISLIIKLMSKK